MTSEGEEWQRRISILPAATLSGPRCSYILYRGANFERLGFRMRMPFPHFVLFFHIWKGLKCRLKTGGPAAAMALRPQLVPQEPVEQADFVQQIASRK